MSDAELRGLERAWLAAPGDVELQSQWTAALRRAGRPVPPWAVDHLRFPARVFDPKRPFAVWGEIPDVVASQRFFGTTAPRIPVAIPAHHVWWIRAERVGSGLRDHVEVVREHDVLGLNLTKSNVNAEQLRILREVPSLRWLSLAGCRRLDAEVLDVLGEQLPQLWHLDLSFAPRRVRLRAEHLEAWPELTHLHLRHCGGDAELALIARHAPRLTRLRIGGAGLTAAGLRSLARLPWLSRLEVGFAPHLSRGDLGLLTELPRLQHLDLIAVDGIEAEDLAQLAEAEALSSLGYFPPSGATWPQGRAINSAEVEALCELTQLEYLSVASKTGLGETLLSLEDQARLEGQLEDCEVLQVVNPARRGTVEELHYHGAPVGRGLLPSSTR